MRIRSRLATVAAVVAAAAVMAVAPTATVSAQESAHQPATAVEMNDRTTPAACVGGMNFRSMFRNQYVLANPGWYYILQARADKPLAWESFTVCKHRDYWTIKADVNGRYVLTNLNDQALLVAGSDSVGLWEKYRFERCDVGKKCVHIRAMANNKYVYAGTAANGTLYATAEEPGGWERFEVPDNFPF